MKRIVLGVLILITSSVAFSQKLFFIYLQSEPEQAFYVKMDEKIHSSTASGYLILSRLRDSSYSFTVGFPQNKWAEQKFNVDLRAKDQGFLLKDFGEKGWGLFNLQTLSVQPALPNKSSGAIKTEPREVSEFTAILSKAADDPSLKERPIAVAAKFEEKPVVVLTASVKEGDNPVGDPVIIKQDRPQNIEKGVAGDAVVNKTPGKETELPVSMQDPPQIIKKDPPVIPKTDSIAVLKVDPPPSVKEESLAVQGDQSINTAQESKVNLPVEYKRSVITKKSESSTSEGFGLTFLDEYADGKKDTIRIIIPNPKKMPGDTKESPDEKKFLDLDEKDNSENKKDAKSAATNTGLEKTKSKPACIVATENDFLKLRRKMAGEKDDEGMIAEAKKMSRSKCFTVVQVKNLSSLFLNDQGRYNFFDFAYDHVLDKDNFSSLSVELRDEYFINRFKAMLR